MPGFQRPLDPLTEHMQRTVDQSLEDVDATLLVLDARQRIGGGDRFAAQRVFALGVPVVIVLNKVDRMKPDGIAAQIDAASKLGDFHALHPLSARVSTGLPELRAELVLCCPRPAYFPADQISDLPLELQVAEVIREKALALTREEVPHAVRRRSRLGEKVVRATVYVETASQKQIVVGKGGRVVREIGVRAPAGDRAATGAPDLPRPSCQGQGAMAQRRAHARAARLVSTARAGPPTAAVLGRPRLDDGTEVHPRTRASPAPPSNARPPPWVGRIRPPSTRCDPTADSRTGQCRFRADFASSGIPSPAPMASVPARPVAAA